MAPKNRWQALLKRLTLLLIYTPGPQRKLGQTAASVRPPRWGSDLIGRTVDKNKKRRFQKQQRTSKRYVAAKSYSRCAPKRTRSTSARVTTKAHGNNSRTTIATLGVKTYLESRLNSAEQLGLIQLPQQQVDLQRDEMPRVAPLVLTALDARSSARCVLRGPVSTLNTRLTDLTLGLDWTGLERRGDWGVGTAAVRCGCGGGAWCGVRGAGRAERSTAQHGQSGGVASCQCGCGWRQGEGRGGVRGMLRPARRVARPLGLAQGCSGQLSGVAARRHRCRMIQNTVNLPLGPLSPSIANRSTSATETEQ